MQCNSAKNIFYHICTVNDSEVPRMKHSCHFCPSRGNIYICTSSHIPVVVVLVMVVVVVMVNRLKSSQIEGSQPTNVPPTVGWSWCWCMTANKICTNSNNNDRRGQVSECLCELSTSYGRECLQMNVGEDEECERQQQPFKQFQWNIRQQLSASVCLWTGGQRRRRLHSCNNPFNRFAGSASVCA